MKAGLSEAKLGMLEEYETSPAFSEPERAALTFATGIVRNREVTDAEWERLRAHFGESEIVELAFAVGYQAFASQFATAFQIAPQGFSGPRPTPTF